MVWSSWIVEALVQIVPFGRCWMFEKGVQTRFMLLTCITSPSVYVQCTSYIERNRYVCIWKRIESTHRIWPFLLCVVVCSELSLLKVIGLWLYIHTHISSLYHVIKTKKHFYMCIILILLFFFVHKLLLNSISALWNSQELLQLQMVFRPHILSLSIFIVQWRVKKIYQSRTNIY